jgi:branched-chain amino acid transport system permease protein
METFVQAAINGVMLGMMYVVIALGLTLVYSILGIVNFAHAEFYMLGGFLTWLLYVKAEMNYFLVLFLAVVTVGFFAMLVERVFFRPFRGKVLEAFIISLGLIWIFQESILKIMGVWDKGAPTAFPGTLKIFGSPVNMERVVVTLIGAGLLIGMYIFIKKTKIGRAMQAIAQDRECAAFQGVNIDRICTLSFGVGCALAAAAGVLLGPVLFINPYMGAPVILKAFIIIILGGLGSIPGCLVGGLFLGMVDSVGSLFVSIQAVEIFTFVFIFLMLVVRPHGLLGGIESHEEE